MYCIILGSCFYFSIPFVVYPSPTSVHQLPSSFSTLLAISNVGERFNNNNNNINNDDDNISMIELTPSLNNYNLLNNNIKSFSSLPNSHSFLSPINTIEVDNATGVGSWIQSAVDISIMAQGSSYNISNTVQLLRSTATSLVTSNNEASFRDEQEEPFVSKNRGSRFSGMQILIVDGNQEASLL